MATEIGSGDPVHDVVNDAERIGERLIGLVRAQPLTTVAVAGVVAALLGGFVFSRASRLLFLAAAGFVANDLLHRDGRFDIDHVINDAIQGVTSRVSR